MRCASSSTAATIPSGWSIRAIPSSGRRVSGSAHDGRFSEVLTHPRDDGVMIGASLRALLALFAILTATAVIAPAYAERVAAPSRPDPAGAAVEALIASATGEMLANPEIGRAAGRESGGQYGEIPGVAVDLKKKNKTE